MLGSFPSIPGAETRAPIGCIRCFKLRMNSRLKCGRCGDVFHTKPLYPSEHDDDEEEEHGGLNSPIKDEKAGKEEEWGGGGERETEEEGERRRTRGGRSEDDKVRRNGGCEGSKEARKRLCVGIIATWVWPYGCGHMGVHSLIFHYQPPQPTPPHFCLTWPATWYVSVLRNSWFQ